MRRRRIGCFFLGVAVLAGGAWWVSSERDVTTVRVGGEVAALGDRPSVNGAAGADPAGNGHAGGPSSPAETGPPAGRNGPRPPEGGPDVGVGVAIGVGRRPTTTTTGAPATSTTRATGPATTTSIWASTTTTTAEYPTTSTSRPPTVTTATTATTSRPTPGPPDARRGQLVYSRDVSQSDPADTDLFIGDLEGRHERRLTSGPDADRFPAWSPDGSTIAFTRFTPTDGGELWLVRPDGSGLRQLTHAGAGSKQQPAWSPDGRFLAFTAAYFHPTRVWIEVLDLSTGRMTAVSEGPMDGQPLWSPDGTTIVYTRRSDTGEDDDLFAVNRDGTGRRAITAAPLDYAYERYGAYGWSADGSRLLVYYSRPEVGHIITLRPDGTGRQDVLNDRDTLPGEGSGTLQFLTWSPDERAIVFNGYAGLRIVNTDGSGLRQLDPPDARRYMADWQPR